MTEFIDDKIESLLIELNELNKTPLKPYSRNGQGKLVSNVGNYHLHSGYKSYQVHQIANERGGIREIEPFLYFTTKKEAFYFLKGLLTGLKKNLDSI